MLSSVREEKEKKETTLSSITNDKIMGFFCSPDSEKNKSFAWIGPKPGGSGFHHGGRYLDEINTEWLIKLASPTDAVREVIASQLYRELVGQSNAPEVQLIKLPAKNKSQTEWAIASRWHDKLGCFNQDSAGIEEMFTASALIGDVDCVEKNIATTNNKIFRYDFGAAFSITPEAQNQFLRMESAHDLIRMTGFDVFNIIGNIDTLKMISFLKQLKLPQTNWIYWQKIYAEAYSLEKNKTHLPESLDDQIKYFSERIELLSSIGQKFSDCFNTRSTETKENNNELKSTLFDYYQFISTRLKIFNPEYAMIMTQAHLDTLKKSDKHPEFFQTIIKEIDTGINEQLFYLNIGRGDIPLSNKMKYLESLKLHCERIGLVMLKNVIQDEKYNSNNFTLFKNTSGVDDIIQIKNLLKSREKGADILEKIYAILVSKDLFKGKPWNRYQTTHDLYIKMYNIILNISPWLKNSIKIEKKKTAVP